MSRKPRRRHGAIALVLSLALGSAGLLSTPSAGVSGAQPTLRLVVGQTKVTLKRPAGRRAYLDIGVYLATEGGPFEIWAARPDYDHPVSIWQVIRDGSLSATSPLPSSMFAPGWRGLARFFHVTVTDASGSVVLDRYHPFCPGSGDVARVDDAGPDVPTFPQFCSGNPFTLGAVWGIDEGWASNLFGYGTNDSIKGPDGHYTATVSIAPTYVSRFAIDPASATATIAITVRSTHHILCHPFCPGEVRGPRRDGHAASAHAPIGDSVPTDPSPDPSIQPDLVALPAWGIMVEHDRRSGRDFLDFGATVWDAGPSPLVVEGFRRPAEPLMDAWQYFYANGEPVARAPAGTLMYDPRPGHQHWHFEQFARYALLSANQSEVVRSEKEAFCLAPTDAIDLTVPGAEWQPYSIGLQTACGSRSSIWTRETLPAGWGDTYVQDLPGQSFDITDLPNGTYLIQIVANPQGALIERSTANNTQLRKVILRGTPGHRTVRVPPWHGIDTEGGGGSGPFPIPAG